MDERLEAGRHHLLHGDKALQDGYLDDSRSHFQAALLQFRGPELRLGEAHALRGLARVELHSGRIVHAEETSRASIREYQEVRAILERVDTEGLSHELWRDAEEGEAAALIVRAEALMRSNRNDAARDALDAARDLYDSLGDVPSASGVWLAIGRLHLREDRLEPASQAFQRGIELNQRSGDLKSACHAWLAQAEVFRLQGAGSEAERALERALQLAREAHDPGLLGRALSLMGSLAREVRGLDAAQACFDEALPLLKDAGDVEMEGYTLLGLGEVASRRGAPEALSRLIEGARLLATLDNQHGLGTAMVRLAEHALRGGAPGLALAAAESARQLWYHIDPVRGVGQALRQEVKALAALKRWPAVVTVAHRRAAVAGAVQPNALQVRDFYRARSPAALLRTLDAMSPDALEDHAEVMIARALEPVLAPLDLDALVLGSVGGALAIVEALAERAPLAPVAAPAQAAEEPLDEARDDDPPELPDDAIEALERFDLEVTEVDARRPGAPPLPAAVADGYEGFYVPPLVPDEVEDEEPASAEEPSSAEELSPSDEPSPR